MGNFVMNDQKPKRLYRIKNGRIIAGVCAGLAEYFNIDPTWVRVLFVIFLIAFGTTLIVYLLLWIIVPIKPEDRNGVNHLHPPQ